MWGILSGFPLANVPVLPDSESAFVYLRVLPLCVKEAYGQVGITFYRVAPLLFYLQGALSVSVQLERPPGVENEKYMVSYLGRAQLLLFFILECLSKGTFSSCSVWGPSLSRLTLTLRPRVP